MRKTIVPALIFLLLSFISNAQLRIALVVGGHTSSVLEKNDLPDWNELKGKYSSRTGAHFGFLADLQLKPNSKLYLQPAVMFYNKGRKFSSNYDTSTFNYSRIDANQFINYVEVPVNLVYKIPFGTKRIFFIGGGPYLSFFYNGREKTTTFLKSGSVTTDEITDLPVGNGAGRYRTFDLGLNGVAGIEFNRVFLSAHFSRSISDFYSASYEGDFKHQVIGGTLGIFLGRPVELEPGIRDKDEDGIVDIADSCIDQAGPLLTNGCPDTDGDGIADAEDKCPDQRGTARYNGCLPKDTDADGVEDADDKCKDVAGSAKYGGCPVPDSDTDGINDEEDSCTSVAGVARYNGCPVPDSDNDGINDEEDKCADQPGLRENKGCPVTEIKEETREKVEFAARRIQFEFSKAVLLEESKIVLDDVAGLLIKNPELLLDIEGHTSNDGSLKANMILSDERANSVKNYLVTKGIDASRLVATGYGPTKPLTKSKTEAERAMNRRVEMKLRTK